jgi:NADH:ubiquinone oxidoreductase subunit E
MSKQADTNTDNRQQVFAAARDVLTPEIVALIEQCRKEPHSESQLIKVLHKVQEVFGYLSPKTLDAVAQLLQVPSSTVSGVATFYHFFRTTPKGKHTINVCLGTACYVKGGQAIADKLREELGIDFGETSGDGMFSLNAARCLGTCGLAPVVMVDDEIHGQVTVEQVSVLLDKYRKQS